jgi:hypothetical protein
LTFQHGCEGNRTARLDHDLQRLGGVNYFFRSRLSFLPVFGPHHRSTIGQPDAEGVRSSC